MTKLMNDASLITETQRRRVVNWAAAMTANTSLAPQRYERQLLARYQQGQLTSTSSSSCSIPACTRYSSAAGPLGP